LTVGVPSEFSIPLLAGIVWGVFVSDGGVTIMQGGGENFAHGTHDAFSNVFGSIGSRVLIVFMIISGLGILNGCCLSMSRAMYSLGRRGLGPLSDRTIELDQKTNVPNNAMVLTVGIGFLWLVVIFMNNMVDWFSFAIPDFYNFSFFALMIPIFICFIIKQKRVPLLQRVVAPVLAIVGAGFMFSSYWIGNWEQASVYLSTFIILAAIGILFFMKKK
jgi:APA family basic amino acid/polyamine antiporter